jgi:hypothetical protein
MTLRQVVQLNNEAAAHLRGGSFTLAIATFSNALQMSREILKQSSVHSLSGDHHQPQRRSLSVDDCMERGSNNAITHSGIVDMDDNNDGYYGGDDDDHHHRMMMISDSPSTSGFLYRHPIQVEPDHLLLLLLGSSLDDDNNSDDDKSCMALCAAVIFNLALAHQLSAATTTTTAVSEENKNDNPSRTTSLQKAERLYHLGYKLYSDELSSLVSSGCPHFLLATINNLGVVYQSLNRLEQAKSTFHVLLSTLIVLGERLGGGRNISNYEGYFHNTTSILLVLERRSAGAA